jgi:cytochrome c biogenesis protein CcmG, thiol:disulfide interchange protein DsbE
MKRVIPLLVFIVFAWMCAVMLLQKERPKSEDHAVHFALPNLTIHAMDDETKRFNVGQEISVINFFASWCTPCLAEHAQLIALKQAFPNVKFHGVAWNDTRKNIANMLSQHGDPYDIVWADSKGEAAIAMGLRGIPETFIVKQGEVIYHLTGPITETVRTQEIEPLLAKD